MRPFLVFILLLSLSLACGSPAETPTRPGSPALDANASPRLYHLGFTPFPHDISFEAIDFTYASLAGDADLVAHHFDSGLPWPEALAGTAYPPKLREDWDQRKSRTPAGHKIYLAITPINWERRALAPYWGETENMPLPSPWDTYPLNHPDVKTAFVNYAESAVEFFKPDYVAIGIEANLLVTNNPSQWDAYLELHRHAYTELKQKYPDLPIFVSLFGLALLDGYRGEDNHVAQMEAFNDLLPYTDYYALSLYPYTSKYMTGNYPATMYDDLFSLSDKPIAIAETGYPAQTLTLDSLNLRMESTPEKQQQYIADLLDQADERGFVFIVNFVLRDYDALWEKIGRTEIAAVWRDTGLYDENGNPRPALETWRNSLRRPHQ